MIKRSIFNEAGEVIADVYGETKAEVDIRVKTYEAAADLLEAAFASCGWCLTEDGDLRDDAPMYARKAYRALIKAGVR